MNYNELKSGTDIRGVASDKGGNKVNLTESAVMDITDAFVVWLSKKTGKKATELKIAIGHDSRITANMIKSAAVSRLLTAGVHIIDCSLASTPAMFMTTVDIGCDASIQITASHHPFDRNGLKFFTKEGGLDSCDIAEIVKLANDGIKSDIADGKIEKVDYMTDYAARLRKMICDSEGKSENDLPLKGYHIFCRKNKTTRNQNGGTGLYCETCCFFINSAINFNLYI